MSEHVTRPKSLLPFIDEFSMPQVLHAEIAENHQQFSPRVRLVMSLINVQFHSTLPSFTLPCFNKQFPGPTIETRHGQTMYIEWSVASAAQSRVTDAIDRLLAFTMPLFSTHTNAQPAAAYAYSAQESLLSRSPVCSRSVGMWLIRDARDEAILTVLNRYELVLFLQACELQVDIHGNLTGQLATQTASDTQSYTLINGKILPYAEIQARPYRLRLVNGAKHGDFQLVLIDENHTPLNNALLQIGDQTGMHAKPIEFTAGKQLALAANASADIIFDFSHFRNQRIYLATKSPMGYRTLMQFRVSQNDSGKSFSNMNLPF